MNATEPRRVADRMTSEVYLCREDDPISMCWRLMRDRKVGFVPVIDRHLQVVGVVTARDLALNTGARQRLGTDLVRDVMNRDVVRVGASDDLAVVDARIHAARQTGAVVVDDQGHCIGALVPAARAQRAHADAS